MKYYGITIADASKVEDTHWEEAFDCAHADACLAAMIRVSDGAIRGVIDTEYGQGWLRKAITRAMPFLKSHSKWHVKYELQELTAVDRAKLVMEMQGEVMYDNQGEDYWEAA